MFSLILLVTFMALVLGGFYYWAQRQRHATVDGTVPADGKRPVSLVTEAMAYAGAVLLLAGGGTAVGQKWAELSDWGHVGVFAIAAGFFVLLGAMLLRVREAAVQRLISVVWLLSAIAVAVAVGIAAYAVYGVSGELTTLSIGLVAAAYSTVLWRVHCGALQNFAVFGSLIVALCGTIAGILGDTAPPLAFSLTLWAFGIGWAALGWLRLAEPTSTAIALGTLLALTAPIVALDDHGWLYAVAITTSAVVMALSVPTRTMMLLVLGTGAAFAYVTAFVLRYFGDELGMPATLAITGGLILVLAVVSARLRRSAQPVPDPAPDPAMARSDRTLAKTH